MNMTIIDIPSNLIHCDKPNSFSIIDKWIEHFDFGDSSIIKSYTRKSIKGFKVCYLDICDGNKEVHIIYFFDTAHNNFALGEISFKYRTDFDGVDYNRKTYANTEHDYNDYDNYD